MAKCKQLTPLPSKLRVNVKLIDRASIIDVLCYGLPVPSIKYHALWPRLQSHFDESAKWKLCRTRIGVLRRYETIFCILGVTIGVYHIGR